MAVTEELQLQWARDILAGDEFFSRMTERDQVRIIQESIEFGIHIAEKTREKLGTPTGAEAIREMLVSLGCGVRVDETSDSSGPMSEYAEDLLAARFYTRRIRQRAAEYADRGQWDHGWFDLYAQCIARELFHHVENTLSGKTSHHVRFRDRLFGLLPVSRPVETTRTIACLTFVKHFLDLPEIPGLIRDA
ncbi:MAG: hypothetical protein GYA36_08555 [Veillonellaceae bacterium]|nr:hypothetical protein [Veillonellaceae bacterium]